MKSIKNSFFKFLKVQSADTNGFTLIELVMTIVILSVAVVSMMNLSSTVLIKSSQSSALSQAVLYAEEKMEEIRADKNNPGRGFDWITTAGNYSTENLANGFTRNVIVADGSHNGISYALIEVVVHHGELSGYQLTTWLTDY